ncbi:diguanylate cyclase [Rhizobium sp. CC-YZS058]|uniref:diguanylate cyclase n=1 Tax=Rhizobium sp. CC-YZS058 TaxID=3042153 RepID=UPI002B053151|nr:diguanylate cyclase [Rhizobium sp. CC-YZS058]MEA3533243.1 diguanylate cyclase [Rhizobium sp. CC-YZS058]
MNLWNDLLGNLAVVAIGTSLWTFCNQWAARRSSSLSTVLLSLFMALGSVAVMLMPFELQPGVYLDLRYTFIAVAGYFGGPLAIAMPVVAALVTRYYIGGTGLWIGVFHILLTAVSVLTIRSLFSKRRSLEHGLFALTITVPFSGTVGFAYMIAPQRWPVVFESVVAPVAVALMVSTLISSLAIVQERRRRAVTNENLIYRAIIEALPDCLNAKDLNGRFIAANPATAELMHADTITHLLGKTDVDFYPPDTAREFRNVELEFLKRAEPITIEQRFTLPSGNETWLSTLKAPIRDEAGAVVGIVTHNREITAQKQVEAQLALAQQRLKEAVSTMANGLAMFDAEGKLAFCNRQYLEMFPLTADVRQVGVSLRTIIKAAIVRGEDPMVHGCEDTMIERTFAALLTVGVREMQLADGRWIETRTRQTAENGALVVFTDITHIKDAETKLQLQNSILTRLAATDALTGLANRRAFDEALIENTLESGRGGHDVALLLIDVDCFKAYNDTYGHQAGDVCLQSVASCVKNVAAAFPKAHVARYGGEEIAVILPNLDADGALRAGERICTAIRSAGLVHETSEKGIVTASVGVAMMSRRQGRRITDLIEDADRELYRAKAGGRDQVRIGGIPTSGEMVSVGVIAANSAT